MGGQFPESLESDPPRGHREPAGNGNGIPDLVRFFQEHDPDALRDVGGILREESGPHRGPIHQRRVLPDQDFPRLGLALPHPGEQVDTLILTGGTSIEGDITHSWLASIAGHHCYIR